MTSFDLRQVKLALGEEHRDTLTVTLPAFAFGGERYLAVPEQVAADFAVTRAVSGTVFTLAFPVRLHGPCHRCLGDAVLELAIRAREYQASDPDDEELVSPYLAGDVLEVSDWARDAVSLALPDKILCRSDCAGLCPECGQDLNEHPHGHDVERLDPRWAALESLREQL